MITADSSEIVREVPALRGHADGAATGVRCSAGARSLPDRMRRSRLHLRFGVEGVSSTRHSRGRALPKGLRESDRLDPPLFSPATKADEGHDENITIDRMRTVVGERWASELENLTRRDLRDGSGDRVGARDHHRGHQARIRLLGDGGRTMFDPSRLY